MDGIDLQLIHLRKAYTDFYDQCSPAIRILAISLAVGFALVFLGLYTSKVLVYLAVAPLIIALVQLPAARETETFKPLLHCPNCNQPTPLIQEWKCGKCKKQHTPGQFWYLQPFPTFIGKCSHCNEYPHSLSCPSCEKPIIFKYGEYKYHPKEISFLPNHPPPPFIEPEKEKEPTLDDLIPLHARQLHTAIVAMPRSGKSEAIKCFVHSLLSEQAACFVFDPHGDMAEEIAKWPTDRLIYLEYDLQEGYTPTVNPFQIHGVDASDYSPQAMKVKKVVAQQLVDAFQRITEDFTFNMATVLFPCIITLLDKPGSTIRDLLNFMIQNTSGQLVRFAITRTHDDVNVQFFLHQFSDSHLNTTKAAIRTKLQRLITAGTFTDLTCGPSTIFLEKAWNEKKIVILNLSTGKIGDIESASFGSLILSLLQGIAIRRAEIDKAERIPCHVFVDECYLFVSRATPKVMAQTLKYGFIVTLAHQHLGQMQKDVEADIHKLCHLSIIGVTTPPQYRSIALYFHLEADDLRILHQGRFIVRIGNAPYSLITFPDTVIGSKGAMPADDWERVKAEMLQRYYRPVLVPSVPAPPPPEEEEEGEGAATEWKRDI